LAAFAFSATRTDLKVGNRTAIVYNPTGYKNPPLVISMHGMGIGAGWNQGMMLFEKYADTAKDKFITVYPQGENNGWDLGGTKDVNFVLAIIDSMVKRYGVDRNRVYATGFSMGGMMSWYLSCKIPDKIAAIVPGNGFPLGGMSGCSEVRHVPVLHIHGTADDFVKYTDFVNSFNPAQRTRYGCPTTAMRISPYPVNKPSSLSFKETWSPCVKNGLRSEINLIHVTGMIHDWATPGKLNANDDPKYKGKPFDIDGTQEAWNWMKLQSLAGPVGIGERTLLSAPARTLSARFVEGRIRMESSHPLDRLELTDLQGRSILAQEGHAGLSTEIAADRLTSGLYILKGWFGPEQVATRIVVP
jgi:predicted esterase